MAEAKSSLIARAFQGIAAWPLGAYEPRRIKIGATEAVLPAGKPSLTPARLRLLTKAWIAADEARPGAVELNVLKLERMSWPAGFEPRRMWPDGAPQDIVKDRRARNRAEFDRAKALNAPLAPAIPPQAVFDLLHLARKNRMKAETLRQINPKRNAKAIKDLEDGAKRAEIDAKRLQGEAAESAWVYAANDETLTLGNARGEEVETKKGETRILTRAGIVHAHGAGYLCPDASRTKLKEAEILATAFAYHEAYDIAAGRTTAGEGAAGFNAKGPQVRLIEAGQALATMRKGASRFELDVLDTVCGQDIRVREASTILRRRHLTVRATLLSALITATDNLRAARAVGETVNRMTKGRLDAAHAMVEAAQRAC
jgi:hypothetical protein